MSRISENIRKIIRAWGGKTTGNGISDALSDLYNSLPFGTKTEMVEILPEQSVTQNRGGEGFWLNDGSLNGFIPTVGANYRVVINNVEYRCTGKDQSMGDVKGSVIDCGKKFNIGYVGFNNSTTMTWDSSLGETITLAIYEEQEIVTPLPAKFMPEPIVFTATDMQTATCNKTYAECLEYYNSNVFNAVIKNPLAGVIPCIQCIYLADEGVIAFAFNFDGEKTGIMYTIDGSITIETMPQ